ncbi:MAG: hypothetical protein AAB316_14445, partial [Bacteroidota bacterium]
MKNVLSLLCCLAACFHLLSQSYIEQSLSVNGTGGAADASALLDVSATDKGVLVPRMTTAQRNAIASPATGLLVFDINTNGFWFFNGAAWQSIGSGMTGNLSLIADADADTKIQVEESLNENVIRFDLAGVEAMRLMKNGTGQARLELAPFAANTFIGLQAGNASTSGSGNTGVGVRVLYKNTVRSNLTALGDSALYNNGDGATIAVHASANA